MNFIINFILLTVAQIDLFRTKSDALVDFLEAEYEALNKGKVFLPFYICLSMSLTQLTMKYYKKSRSIVILKPTVYIVFCVY